MGEQCSHSPEETSTFFRCVANTPPLMCELERVNYLLTYPQDNVSFSPTVFYPSELTPLCRLPSVHARVTERPGIAGCQPLHLASHCRMGDGQNIILKQPLLSHRMPICLIGVARSTGFEPVSRTFVGWHTIHCANRAYNKLTDRVFSIDRYRCRTGT